MTDSPWYPFFVGDYARKTAHLSMLEHGAYRLLIDHYFCIMGPIPNDPARLFRICRARSPSERKAVLSVTADFFKENGALLHHERCDSEIARILKKKETNSANARRQRSPSHSERPSERTSEPASTRARTTTTTRIDSEAKASSPTPIALPDWLSVDLFRSFNEMRKSIKRPMTRKAEELILSKLDRLRREGHDPVAVLEQSILNCWQDVFPVKGDQAGRSGSIGKNSVFTKQDYLAGTDGFEVIGGSNVGA